MRTLNADQLKAVLSMESSLGHIHTLDIFTRWQMSKTRLIILPKKSRKP